MPVNVAGASGSVGPVSGSVSSIQGPSSSSGSSSADAILWIGLFLIAMLVVANWTEIKNTIF